MMFSAIDKAKKRFEQLLERAGKAKRDEITALLGEVKDGDEADLIVWLYANSPLSDMANYDFGLFRAFAKHGVFLRRQEKCKDIPEDIFLSYVVHPRMGGEEICDCRNFFYDLLSPRISGMSEKEAIIELNYFNAENVKYVSTDYRTLNALATYNSTFGRCGEESVFAVNVFRALGIPARQIYTPRWAHCDDNHAWVEVWCDGDWHFLGACEPEEVLDRGWFVNAAGRAMLVQSRTFGETNEEVQSKLGIANLVDDLGRYAACKRLKVKVTRSGKSVEGAKVSIGILNHSHIFPCAAFVTDRDGCVDFNCGLGSLNIQVNCGDIYLEKLVYTPEVSEVKFELKSEPPIYDEWQDFVSVAPKDGLVKGNIPTKAQKELCRVKTAAANNKREERVKAMFDEERARAVTKKFSLGEDVFEMVRESYGNGGNILSFLEDESFSTEEKSGVLRSLDLKDLRDIDVAVLKEVIETSRPYKSNFKGNIYYDYVVCPRVWFERLTVNRRFILSYFSEEQKEKFRSDPRLIWQYIRDNITYYPDFEYGSTITSPVGLLTVKSGHYMSQKLLFVVICRTLGIAARLDPVNLLAQFYDGEFVSVEAKEDEGDCILVLKKEGSYRYLTDFAVGVFSGGNYENLELEDKEWDGDEMRLRLKSGNYRIITDNRLPNGNILASKYYFTLSGSETKQVKLHRHEAELSDMLLGYSFDDFSVTDGKGRSVKASEITRTRTVLMWLSDGEPTMHILNEMLDNAERFKVLPCKVAFMLGDGFENEKVNDVLNKIGNIEVYFDKANAEPLARRMFLDPEKTPLIVIAKELKADYASSGYNVGSGDMIIKICDMLVRKGQ